MIGEVDYFDFVPLPGGTAEITLTTISGFPGSEPQMEIFSPSGVDLGAFNADTGTPHPIAIQETGTYAVRVIGNTLMETGSYSISLNCLPAPFGAVFLGANTLSPGQITMASELDPFEFDGEMNEVVELTLVRTSGFAGTNVRATLYSPIGTNLGTFVGNSRNEITLPSTGRYSVDVDAANGTGVGDYNLVLDRRFPAEPLPPPLVCGQVYPSTITAPGELDHFSFEGNVNDVVDLTLVWKTGFTATGVSASVYSPTDAFLGSFSGTSLFSLTLPETGRYIVRVNANNLVGIGSYNLGLGCRVPDAADHVAPGLRRQPRRVARPRRRARLLHLRRELRRHDRPDARLAHRLLRRGRGRERVVALGSVRGQRAGDGCVQLDV